MFRIRRIDNDVLTVDQAAIREAKLIFHDRFPAAPAGEIDLLEDKLRNPIEQQFRTLLYVAENERRRVTGFALVLYEPVLGFCYLDYLAARSKTIGRGIGAALYESVRHDVAEFGVKGIFFECLPDEPELCSDPVIRKKNAARLKFYEQFGARPIIGTKYEMPIPGRDPDNMPVLMFDGLNGDVSLSADYMRQAVRAILEGKYADLCPPEYVDAVVESYQDPIRLREFRYRKPQAPALAPPSELIAVTINDKHDIHHIRERGYVESPVRIPAISRELIASGMIETVQVKEYPLSHITAVHDTDFVDYLRNACENAPERKSVYPYVFPIRNAARPPKDLSVLAGYYCIDTFTPINRNAFPAAKRAVDCAMTAADEILNGRHFAYALVRPPGHHAERRNFGGFCYFNNAAVAAHHFSTLGKVAILDVDYHHGNGQQEIFYERNDVFTISIHGDPEFAYPYFTGFDDERGAGTGEGFNLNISLPEIQDGPQYRQALERAVEAIQNFAPAYLVIALGLDAAKGDPTGTWLLTAKDFELNGEILGRLHYPTLVVQEGGYRTRTLGTNARHFFRGLIRGHGK